MMEQKNLVVAIALSLAILLGFQYFYELPRQRARHAAEPPATAEPHETQRQSGGAGALATPPASPQAAEQGSRSPAATPSGRLASPAELRDRTAVLADHPRVRIRSPRVAGSIDLVGGRIDDITLTQYRETIDPNSPEITLLNPPGAADPYFAQFGWVAKGGAEPVPDDATTWTADGQEVAPDHPVTLSWVNPSGVRFLREVALDENYMLTVTQRVENGGAKPLTLYPYGLIARTGKPKTLGYFILHEGFVGVVNGTLQEHKYGKMDAGQSFADDTTGGWLGLTDKYWLVALVPNQHEAVKTKFSYTAQDGVDHYQADYLGAGLEVAPGATAEDANRLFAGAKEVKLLERYRDTLGIPRFDYAVDWGWFFFLTQPIFKLMDWIYGHVGNFGISILLLTITIKALFLPLATRSYVMMSKMKLLGPKLNELKAKFGDDKVKLNQEMMALYKREKVNPLSGCLPMFLQIPVFFSLYKVLFVTIEMRHAPFFGWIQDLSAPDPTNLFNLFGLVSFDAPSVLHFGAWPLIMGATMFLQQRLNPQPTDPVQAKVFMFMPLIFMVMLAKFPSGLVIYWAWNNTLSIAQQWFIMRRRAAAAA